MPTYCSDSQWSNPPVTLQKILLFALCVPVVLQLGDLVTSWYHHIMSLVDEAALPVSASMGTLSSVLCIGTSDVVLVPGGLG